jgi:nanoRNase/pAp phosphatase (c-di-AMP/oligoRNAs hydrolase)
MSLTKDQQIHRLLQQSERILILLPAAAGGDHYATATAWAHFFTALGKAISVGGASLDQLKARYEFLTPPPVTMTTLSGLRDFVLSFNTKHNKILGIRTETVGDEYKVFVTPEKGSLDPRDFSILPVHFAYDCLVILGASDRISLGALAEENPDIFYEIPVINIDHHPDNEQFGQINLVDLTASSLAEISVDIFASFDAPQAFTEAVAEDLLAGLMVATESFQKKTTTPKAFQLAARLIDQGADQQKLVQHLFKTQPFHILKLWGQIMTTLHWEEPAHILVGHMAPADLAFAQAAVIDIPLVIEKIQTHTAINTLLVLLFAETATRTMIFVHTHDSVRLEHLQRQLAPLAPSLRNENHTLFLSLDQSLTETQTLLQETFSSVKNSPPSE